MEKGGVLTLATITWFITVGYYAAVSQIRSYTVIGYDTVLTVTHIAAFPVRALRLYMARLVVI